MVNRNVKIGPKMGPQMIPVTTPPAVFPRALPIRPAINAPSPAHSSIPVKNSIGTP